jgi:hypothetical protein
MSFQRSSALEAQPTTWRREDDPQYADDPEVAKLGTKHETARVRERVKTTSDETSEKFKEIGEGLKKIATWPDVGVRHSNHVHGSG